MFHPLERNLGHMGICILKLAGEVVKLVLWMDGYQAQCLCPFCKLP